MLQRDGQRDKELVVKKDAWLLARILPAIALNDIARILLQTQKRKTTKKKKTSTESRTEDGTLP